MAKETAGTMRRGFFTYAWDLDAEGPRRTAARMADNLGANAVMVNALYHHARVFRPRSSGPKTLRYDRALAFFQPQPAYYRESGLLPAVEDVLAGKEILDQTRAACQEQGLDFGLWVVGLHNSTLGEAHPERCVENLFGDKYTYALCPGQSENQAYLQGLVGDVSDQFSPDRLLVEAAGTLGLHHGLHHELFLQAWDQVLELLFSRCFCPACQARARARGIAVDALREKLRGIADRLLEEERGALPLEFRQHEVPSLLLEFEELRDYVQMGCEVVTDLVKSLRDAAAADGGALEIIPASFHRPGSSAWLEGGSLRGLADASDGLLVPAYFEDAPRVEADLNWAGLLAEGAPLSAGLNACSPAASAAGLQNQVLACRRAGCRGVYYYNYGLLSEKRLDWVRKANQALQRAEGEE